MTRTHDFLALAAIVRKGGNPNHVASGPGGGQFTTGSGGGAAAGPAKKPLADSRRKKAPKGVDRGQMARVTSFIRREGPTMSVLQEKFPDMSPGQLKSAVRNLQSRGKVKSDRMTTHGESSTSYLSARRHREINED